MEHSSSPHADERILSAIGYAGILFLIPLFFKKESPFCQFHGKQGFVLFLAWIINSLIMAVPLLGWVIGFFGSVFLAVLTIIAIIQAVKGEQWELPIIGEYARSLHL